jgi:hypothetical protein
MNIDWDALFGPLRVSLPALREIEGVAYRVLFIPAFHRRCAITIYGLSDDPWVEVKVGMQPHRAQIKPAVFNQFERSLREMDYASLSPKENLGLDGLLVEFQSRTADCTSRFNTWSPGEALPSLRKRANDPESCVASEVQRAIRLY